MPFQYGFKSITYNCMQAIATAMQLNLHANVLHWKLYSSQNGSFRAAAAMHNRLRNFSQTSHDVGKLSGHREILHLWLASDFCCLDWAA